jgi:ammonium transporter, Amt family
MNLIPGLSLRASAADEEIGVDEAELGEFAYDFVEYKRDLEAIIFREAKVVNFTSGDRGEGVYSSGGSGEDSMEMRLMPVSLRDEEQLQREHDQDV